MAQPYSSRPGREIIQPSELPHYRFVRDARGEDTHEVWRDGHLVVGSAVGFGLDRLTTQYLRREEEERETESALRSRDPLTLCRLGWHRTEPGVWFRLAAGKPNDLWIYRVGPDPFDYLCTTIWSYGHPRFFATPAGALSTGTTRDWTNLGPRNRKAPAHSDARIEYRLDARPGITVDPMTHGPRLRGFETHPDSPRRLRSKTSNRIVFQP